MTSNITSKEWKEFFLSDIFTTIKRGKRLIKENQIAGDTPYISSTKTNNGTDGFIGNTENVRRYSHCLTIANSGSVGSVFYHDYEFIASDHVTALVNENLSKEQYIFIGTSLKKIGEKYSFNREISDKRITREKVLLPVNEQGEPDYDYMTEFILVKSSLVNGTYQLPLVKKVEDKRELSEVIWKDFSLSDSNLFVIENGVRLTKHDMLKGTIPYIGSSEKNNGVTEFIQNKNSTFQSNTLSMTYNSGAKVFYHPYFAVYSDNVRIIRCVPKISSWCYRFIQVCLQKQSKKFSYGYPMSSERLLSVKILLPSTDSGEPNFQFMEQYMLRKQNEVINKLSQ
ncbi:restriction endonuclease subunit S [Bacillus cereus]|uniref:restriction endonuclease subunit S n=1 Tax=Bacillus cereus TaxID=1396 RepID=UPI0015D48555|nr:restriction endonuclease subunit S [Bacillus cereus]